MDPEHRYRSFRIIGMLPGLYDLLSEPTRVSLSESIDAAGEQPPSDLSFVFAERIPALRPRIEQAVAQFDEEALADAIGMGTTPVLWPPAIKELGKAGSFRGAEGRFESFISPFAGQVSREEAEDLLTTITGNVQISHASGIPALLEKFMLAQPPGCFPIQYAWDQFYEDVGRYRRHYEDVWALLERGGWNRPDLHEDD